MSTVPQSPSLPRVIYSNMTGREKLVFTLLGCAIGGLYGATFSGLLFCLTFPLTGFLGPLLAMLCAGVLSFAILRFGFQNFRPTAEDWVKRYLASTAWSRQQAIRAEDIVLPNGRW